MGDHGVQFPRAADGARPSLRVNQEIWADAAGYWRVPHDIRSTLLYTAALGLPRAVTTSLRAR